MTRIVGGQARGRHLAVPPRGTRPTSDRAREALFNTLRSELDLDGARVLDLFAGSGAVGLEALSRGAAAAVFVESDQRAAAVLAGNVAAVGLPGAVIRRLTVERYLSATGAEEPFDLVFADPPYAVPAGSVATALRLLVDGGWLTEHAVVVIERAARDPEPLWPGEIKPIKQRRYGEGSLWYGRRT
ncbi:MAG TPA: 16S rRNA (guanine(966)-N(2))-methyltransferase RsmD [Jatrophihabitans sp.]|nr:16S rRNA (guanine(966)-N(2))-methyltransferase RsmD [Jatrophihabitans sp.]